MTLTAITLVALTTAADEPTLKSARQRYLRGNYEEARAQYQALAPDPKAAVGVSLTWQAQGESDKALAALDAALAKSPTADLHARRADLLYSLGRFDEAAAAAATALKAGPDHFLARIVQARISRDRGEIDQADQQFRWFVRTYTKRSNEDNDVKDPDELMIVAEAGAENARWHALTEQFKFILKEVYGDVLKSEPDHWRADFAAGALLLEKYNRPEAIEAFDKALAINPHAAEALVGKGQAALQGYEMTDADSFADQALKVNPRLPAALRLKADVAFAAGDFAAAQGHLEKARVANPRDEATLARLAAVAHARRDKPAAAAITAAVEQRNKKPGLFYSELGEALEGRRFYDEADAAYRKAIELRPNLPEPRNGLGLLLMRLGKEKEAREQLDAAFKGDKYNVRVANSRKVLMHLDRYETVTTDHFEVRFDPKTDRLQAAFLAEYLEECYAQLAKDFDYQCKGKILYEVFSTHEMFSGRTVALPDLHTIGACTGKVIAMASPHAKGVRKPFNWGRVVRHELVHIVNLEQTNYQCPHWLTEGLAVRNEGIVRPPAWRAILRDRFEADDLLTLDTINLGFIRPRNPAEWNLAYCQSHLYVEYLTKHHGPQAVAKLLAAYRDGKDTDAAIKSVCGVDKAAFEKGYRDHVADLVRTFPGGPPKKADPDKPKTFAQLEEAHEANPDDTEVAATLAEAMQRRNRPAEARKLADGVLAKDKAHPLASIVKSRLVAAAGDTDGALALLEAALDRAKPEPRVLRELGRVYFQNKQSAKAAEVYELGRKLEPGEPQWLEQLAAIYEKAGERDKQIEVLRELIPLDADDLDSRKKLMKLFFDAGDHAEAAKYAKEALFIDVNDELAQDLLMQSLEVTKAEPDLTRYKKLLKGGVMGDALPVGRP